MINTGAAINIIDSEHTNSPKNFQHFPLEFLLPFPLSSLFSHNYCSFSCHFILALIL